MFKSLEEALQVLEARKNQTLGVKGLLLALEDYHNPQDSLSCIHIGGTNGKGSTTDFTRAILETKYRVGTFTSPHLTRHNERICINKQPIPDSVFLKYINETLPVWEKHNLSMFEIDMLISTLYFKDEKVDLCIYEVGLGGRLDATNVIQPKVSAITHIGFDHMNILGDSLAKIAYEKAGIFKKGVPVYTMERNPEALTVLRERAKEIGAPFFEVSLPEVRRRENELFFTYKDIEIEFLKQPLYQVENACLAIELALAYDGDLSKLAIKEAVEKTRWAGRFEEILPGVFLDGAHNLNGIERLIESLVFLPKPWNIIFTALKDKDHHEMVAKLNAVADVLIVTQFDFPRAQIAVELAKGHDCQVIEDYQLALETGLSLEGTLIVTGSLYFISQARAFLLQQNL